MCLGNDLGSHSPPKHHKKASKAITKLNEVKGFNEFRRFRGTKTRTSEKNQLLHSSSVIKIMRDIIPPKQASEQKK
jgi:hypothetical protein